MENIQYYQPFSSFDHLSSFLDKSWLPAALTHCLEVSISPSGGFTSCTCISFRVSIAEKLTRARGAHQSTYSPDSPAQTVEPVQLKTGGSWPVCLLRTTALLQCRPSHMPGAVKRRRAPAGRQRRGLSEGTVQRLILRAAVFLAAAGVYLYTRQEKVLELATIKDSIGKRSQPVDCSPKYAAETANFPGCSPSRCGRLISDRVVTPHEARTLRHIASRAFALTGGSGGGASILDLHSGALSKGSAFVNVYRLPEAHDLLSEDDLRLYTGVKRRVAQLVTEHFGLEGGVLHLAKPTFFSRITAAAARTVHDQYWHSHVDKETYPSFHYTSLVYLNDYGSDFTGGRFIYNDKDANRTIEPKAGRVSAFTAGWENPHQVEPVADGVRFALTVAFTCDASQAISDPAHAGAAPSGPSR